MQRRTGIGFVMLLAGPLAVAGCTSGSDSLERVDPAAAPLHPTWAEVEPILDRNCVPCHSGGEQNYTTCSATTRELEEFEEVVFEEGSMPPGAWPRLDERQKLIIRRWIRDGAPCAP